MMFWKIVLGLIPVVTWACLPTHLNGFWAPKAAVWTTGWFLLASSGWWAPAMRSTPHLPWLGMLMAWMLMRFCWQLYPNQLMMPGTVERAVVMRWPMAALPTMLTAFASFLALEALVRHSDYLLRWQRVAMWLGWTAGLVALYGVAQLLHLDPLQLGSQATMGRAGASNVPITVFGNQGLTAQYLAIVAPLCLIFRPWVYRIFYGLMAVVILASTSLTSVIALWVSTLIVLAYRRCWWLCLSLVGIALVGVVYVHLTHQAATIYTPSDRLVMWSQAWTVWKAAPLLAWTGFGLGAVESAHINGFWGWAHLHCEPLQIIFELGVIGGGLLMGFLITVGHRLWVMPKSLASMGWIASLVSFSLISLVNFPLRIGATLMLGVLSLAAVLSYHEGAVDG